MFTNARAKNRDRNAVTARFTVGLALIAAVGCSEITVGCTLLGCFSGLTVVGSASRETDIGQVTYTQTFPNGRRCGGACQNAVVTANVPG